MNAKGCEFLILICGKSSNDMELTNATLALHKLTQDPTNRLLIVSLGAVEVLTSLCATSPFTNVLFYASQALYALLTDEEAKAPDSIHEEALRAVSRALIFLIGAEDGHLIAKAHVSATVKVIRGLCSRS